MKINPTDAAAKKLLVIQELHDLTVLRDQSCGKAPQKLHNLSAILHHPAGYFSDYEGMTQNISIVQ